MLCWNVRDVVTLVKMQKMKLLKLKFAWQFKSVYITLIEVFWEECGTIWHRWSSAIRKPMNRDDSETEGTYYVIQDNKFFVLCWNTIELPKKRWWNVDMRRWDEQSRWIKQRCTIWYTAKRLIDWLKLKTFCNLHLTFLLVKFHPNQSEPTYCLAAQPDACLLPCTLLIILNIEQPKSKHLKSDSKQKWCN